MLKRIVENRYIQKSYTSLHLYTNQSLIFIYLASKDTTELPKAVGVSYRKALVYVHCLAPLDTLSGM